MKKKPPQIKGSDFAEACQRFFSHSGERIIAEELGLKPPPPLPPPSKEVLEIMIGLRRGWDSNPSIKAWLESVKNIPNREHKT